MKPTAAVQEASTANVRISGTGNACLQLLDQVHQYFIPLQIHCVAATNAIAHDDMYMHSLSYLHVCTTRYHMQKIVVSTTNSFHYSHYALLLLESATVLQRYTVSTRDVSRWTGQERFCCILSVLCLGRFMLLDCR